MSDDNDDILALSQDEVSAILQKSLAPAIAGARRHLRDGCKLTIIVRHPEEKLIMTVSDDDLSEVSRALSRHIGSGV